MTGALVFPFFVRRSIIFNERAFRYPLLIGRILFHLDSLLTMRPYNHGSNRSLTPSCILRRILGSLIIQGGCHGKNGGMCKS